MQEDSPFGVLESEFPLMMAAAGGQADTAGYADVKRDVGARRG